MSKWFPDDPGLLNDFSRHVRDPIVSALPLHMNYKKMTGFHNREVRLAPALP